MDATDPSGINIRGGIGSEGGCNAHSPATSVPGGVGDSCKHSPKCSGALALKCEFETFFAERKTKKSALYLHVAKLGTLLTFAGLILVALFWFFVWYFAATSFAGTAAVTAAIFVSGSVALLGFLVISSVPTDELCVDTLFGPAVSGAARLLLVAIAIGIGCVWQSTSAILLFILGAWIALAMPEAERAGLCALLPRLRLHGHRAAPPAAAPPSAPALFPTTYAALFSPQYLSTAVVLLISGAACVLLQMWVVNAVIGSHLQSAPYSPAGVTAVSSEPVSFHFRLLSVINGVCTLIVAASPLYFFISARHSQKAGGREKRGWRTDILYNFGSLCFVCLAIVNAQAKAISWAWNGLDYDAAPFASSVTEFAFAALFAVAGLWRPLGGARWIFSLIARRIERRFDFDREQLRKDGAVLASLVTHADTLNWGARCHWVQRPKAAAAALEGRFPPVDDTVKRQFWMLGHLVARRGEGSFFVPQAPSQLPADALFLRVSFKEDADASWTAGYVGNGAPRLEFRRLLASHAAADFFAGNFDAARGAGPSFAAWRAANFPPDGEPTPACRVEHVDLEGGSVYLRVPFSNAPQTGEQILNTSKSSLRRFTPSWKEGERCFFRRDLLEVSPRDVEEASKKGIYDLSEDVAADGGIDFFLSHSWDEEGEGRAQKYDALASFLCGSAPRAASLWFDKTCLNTADKAANATAIAALPIFTAACGRVIVLLSPTYLRRLWCVWELQCVFTFCLRELAVERIVVVLAGGEPKDALTWSLDRAHTFDPNEEYRLRSLVHAIGVERFVETVRNLPSCSIVSAPPPSAAAGGSFRSPR